MQRVKEVEGGREYEVGDIVSYDGRPHIVYRVQTRYEDQTPDQWEYDVAENELTLAMANGGELSPWPSPLPDDAEAALRQALRALTTEESETTEDAATHEAIDETATPETIGPQRGNNTRFGWNAGELAEKSEVDQGFWGREMEGVESANRRQITASGTAPLGPTDVAGGSVWARHQVDFIKQGQGYRKQTGGFSFTYEGSSADVEDAHWLQFISITMVETTGGKELPVDDGDERVWFTVDDSRPRFGVDYSKASSPYYLPSVQQSVGVGRLQKTMIDDPLPSVGPMRERIGKGATRVVETDTFDTFLVQRGKVVYHGQVRVAFTCDASGMVDEHPITKTSEVTRSEPAAALPEAMREALHAKYSQFSHIN